MRKRSVLYAADSNERSDRVDHNRITKCDFCNEMAKTRMMKVKGKEHNFCDECYIIMEGLLDVANRCSGFFTQKNE